VRINSLGGVQHAALDDTDAAEGLSVFFSQNGESVCRYRVVVKARIDQGLYDMGEFYISPPFSTDQPGRLSRMIAGAVCPGATGWAVEVTAVPSNDEGTIPSETADIVLASSRCCTAPVGVTRVAERYQYVADSNVGISSFTVRAGMRITGIAAIGLTGGGTITIAGGATITVPENISANLEPEASIAPNSIIAITNCDWVIEWVESA
jgi:hypothetical protein